MRTFLLVVIALSFTLVPGRSAAQPDVVDSLTVEGAISLALENHPVIRQAEYGAAASGARIGISRSSYSPDIAFSGSYARIGPVPSIDIPGMGSFQFYPYNNYDFHVALRQTLYDFGRVATAVELAQAAHVGSGDYVEMVRYGLAYQTIMVFYSIMILHENIGVLDEQIEALSQHLDASVKRMRAGTATDFDTLTTRVRIAAAGNDRIDAARALQTQEIIFRQLTGLPQERPVVFKGAFASGSLIPNPDSLLAAAKEARPELELARDAERTAMIQTHLASLGDRPSLVLDIEPGLKNGYIPNLNTLKGNFVAGLELRAPIFNGHRTRHQEEEADANLRSARAREDDLWRQVVSEVQQAIAGVKSSHEKIETSEIQVTQAETALSMADVRYGAGVATNLDLLDAQTALSQAKLMRLRAFYDYTVSLTALDKATGKRVW